LNAQLLLNSLISFPVLFNSDISSHFTFRIYVIAIPLTGQGSGFLWHKLWVHIPGFFLGNLYSDALKMF
jgi:hypothetical protein